jgi:hypothetical protein
MTITSADTFYSHYTDELKTKYISCTTESSKGGESGHYGVKRLPTQCMVILTKTHLKHMRVVKRNTSFQIYGGPSAEE